MARIRTIKPEFPQSETIGRLSREARLLFIELWTVADDCGRARGNSRILASLLYPFDNDAFGLMDGWIAELEREHCVVRYATDGNTYIQILNWLKHQKIDKPSPSRLPEFDESSRNLANDNRGLATDLVSRTLDPVPSTEDRKPSRGKREPDSRSGEFKSACEAYYTFKHLVMTWDAAEGKQLSALLAANPALDLAQFQGILRNRSKSQVNHAERPRAWLSRATDYAAGPLDKFGKPLEGNNAGRTFNTKSKSGQVLDDLRRSLEEDGFPVGFGEAGNPQAGQSRERDDGLVRCGPDGVGGDGRSIGVGITLLSSAS